MNDPSVERDLQLYERMHEAMIPLVQRHIVAVIAHYDGNAHHHATGTLVRFGDQHAVLDERCEPDSSCDDRLI